MPESKQIIFKEIQRSEKVKILVYKDEYKGKEILSVRKFFWNDDEETYLPGKGVTFNHEDIDDIIKGLQYMLAWCEADITEDQIVGGYYVQKEE